MAKPTARDNVADQIETRKMPCPTRRVPLRLGSLAHPKTKKLGLEHTLMESEETNFDLIRVLDDFGLVEDGRIGFHDESALESDPFDLLGDTRALPISFQHLLPDRSKLPCQLLYTTLLLPSDASECTARGDENSSSLGRISFLAHLLE